MGLLPLLLTFSRDEVVKQAGASPVGGRVISKGQKVLIKSIKTKKRINDQDEWYLMNQNE